MKRAFTTTLLTISGLAIFFSLNSLITAKEQAINERECQQFVYEKTVMRGSADGKATCSYERDYGYRAAK